MVTDVHSLAPRNFLPSQPHHVAAMDEKIPGKSVIPVTRMPMFPISAVSPVCFLGVETVFRMPTKNAMTETLRAMMAAMFHVNGSSCSVLRISAEMPSSTRVKNVMQVARMPIYPIAAALIAISPTAETVSKILRNNAKTGTPKMETAAMLSATANSVQMARSRWERNATTTIW